MDFPQRADFLCLLWIDHPGLEVQRFGRQPQGPSDRLDDRLARIAQALLDLSQYSGRNAALFGHLAQRDIGELALPAEVVTDAQRWQRVLGLYHDWNVIRPAGWAQG